MTINYYLLNNIRRNPVPVELGISHIYRQRLLLSGSGAIIEGIDTK